MLRLNTSGRLSRFGPEADPVPCVQCERRERGLAWGDFCSVCKEERRRRADRIAQRWAIGAAFLLGIYLIWRTPPEMTQRIFAAISVILVYVIVRRLVSRLHQEFSPKEIRK